jgi:hypothetical protein
MEGATFGSTTALNLALSTTGRDELRAAFLRAHPTSRPADVKGPLRGSVYYARYRGREWALATFSLPAVGATDQPERFRRPVGGRWKDLGDTGGPVSHAGFPCPVLRAWGFRCG